MRAWRKLTVQCPPLWARAVRRPLGLRSLEQTLRVEAVLSHRDELHRSRRCRLASQERAERFSLISDRHVAARMRYPCAFCALALCCVLRRRCLWRRSALKAVKTVLFSECRVRRAGGAACGLARAGGCGRV